MKNLGYYRAAVEDLQVIRPDVDRLAANAIVWNFGNWEPVARAVNLARWWPGSLAAKYAPLPEALANA